MLLLLILVTTDHSHSYTKHSLSSVLHPDDSLSLSYLHLLYPANIGLQSVNFQITVRAIEYVLSHTWNPADHFHRCVYLLYKITDSRSMDLQVQINAK